MKDPLKILNREYYVILKGIRVNSKGDEQLRLH